MTFFAVEYHYDSSQAQTLDELRPSHRAYLTSLKERGINAASGPLIGTSHALLIIRAADEAEVRTYLDKDPFFEAGLILNRNIREWNPLIRIFD